MLEKNKDYVEFTLQYTSVDWARSKDRPEVCLKGDSDFSFPGVPIMDVVCNEFDHKVVVVSKRDFEALQTENEQLKKKLEEFSPIPEYKEFLMHLYSVEDAEKLEWVLRHVSGGMASTNEWIAISKFWKNNYAALSELVGFSSVEEIQDYLTNEAECDTLSEAVSKLKDQVKYTCDEWFSANSRNNSWKAAAECNSPKELIEKLNLLRDDISGRSTVIERYKRDIEKWQKATGCLRPEDISTESMISKSMANEITVANEELWSENEKCEKRIEALQKEIGIYSRTLNEWKEGTGCPSPSAAKTLIESGASWHHAYNEAKASNVKLRELEKENADLYAEIRKWKDLTKSEIPEAAATWISSYESACGRGNRLAEMVEKLKEEVVSWKNVTGYSTPEDYMHARISGAFHTPFDYTATWQKATGCLRPEDISTASLVTKAMQRDQEWREGTGCPGPIAAKALIESGMAYEHGYHEAQEENRKLTEEVDSWKNVTGYSTPEDYMHARINNATPFDYTAAWQDATGCVTPDQVKSRIEGLENAVRLTNRNMIKEIESNIDEWQKATGCDVPEKAQCKITDLYNRIDKMKEAASIASNWTDKIVEG